MGIDLTDDQIFTLYKLEHWWKAKDKQLFQISGAPGTGKSTIIRYFIERLGLNLDTEVLFMAYMGKACSRLVQDGLPARTIHSTIYNQKRREKKDENGKRMLSSSGRPIYEYYFELKEYIPKKIKLFVVDEASTVPEDIAVDLLSFEIPTVTLGDLNQLPPVFGKPYFLQTPDAVLRQIMRQKEGDPIVWISNEILQGRIPKYGIYGKSSIIRKEDISDHLFKSVDIVVSGTNRTRYNVNNYFRESILHLDQLDRINRKEKLVCRKNNWSRKTVGGIYLMNGTIGYVTKVTHRTYNGKTIVISFRPDFTPEQFTDLTIDFNHLFEIPDGNTNSGNKYCDTFEFAYAVTCHSMQGSEARSVLYLHEPFMRDPRNIRRLMYTAVTRARERIIMVI